MGIVFNQSYKNIIIISLAMLIGGINTLYFYPVFLKDEYYGLVVFLLATSNLLMPLVAFGSQHTIIKYFSSFKNKRDRDSFMSSVILIPLLTIIPITILVIKFHDLIGKFLSIQNPIIESYVWVIFLVAFATSYFEVFYSWARVQLKSVFGNFLKEIFPRFSVLILLIFVSLDYLSKEDFVWWLTGLYYMRLLLMIVYSFSLYTPKITFNLPKNIKSILTYSFYIFLAGSAASILIDIDKFMIPQKEAISQTAFYAVAVFIATVVEVPGRAMFQIINPLVAKSLNENNLKELKILYRKSSINLLIIAGLFFLLININIEPFYKLMSNSLYGDAIWVVLMISISKLILMSFGCGPAILATSKFYKITLPFSVFMAITVYFLNDILIDIYSINGAALSTLIVVSAFTLIKVIYIRFKLNIMPYSIHSLKVLGIILLIFILFGDNDGDGRVIYFLFKNIDFEFPSLIKIALNSLLVALLYTIIIYKSKSSESINLFIDNLIKRKFRS